IGSKCLLVIRVSGCSRVPLPPARITPLSEPSIGRGCYAPVGCDCSSKAAAGTWTRPACFQCSVITVPLSRRPVLLLVAQTSLAKCVRSAGGNEEPQKARRRPRSALQTSTQWSWSPGPCQPRGTSSAVTYRSRPFGDQVQPKTDPSPPPAR